MKTWLLIIVLTLAADVEQHVAIIMPDEETCEAMRKQFVYSVRIDDEGYTRTPLTVDEVVCEGKEVTHD